MQSRGQKRDPSHFTLICLPLKSNIQVLSEDAYPSDRRVLGSGSGDDVMSRHVMSRLSLGSGEGIGELDDVFFTSASELCDSGLGTFIETSLRRNGRGASSARSPSPCGSQSEQV
jgi:hypothetical protein